MLKHFPFHYICRTASVDRLPVPSAPRFIGVVPQRVATNLLPFRAAGISLRFLVKHCHVLIKELMCGQG